MMAAPPKKWNWSEGNIKPQIDDNAKAVGCPTLLNTKKFSTFVVGQKLLSFPIPVHNSLSREARH